jgi:hypothetical protein
LVADIGSIFRAMNSHRNALASSVVLAATLAMSSSAFADEPARTDLVPSQPSLGPVREDAPRTESRLVPELYITGPLVFGVTYGLTIGITHAAANPGDVSRATAYAAIPLVGPWVLMGSKLPTMPYTPALIASGIGQAGGLALTIAGLVVHRDVPLPSVATDKVRVTFVPSGAGAAAIGSF